MGAVASATGAMPAVSAMAQTISVPGIGDFDVPVDSSFNQQVKGVNQALADHADLIKDHADQIKAAQHALAPQALQSPSIPGLTAALPGAADNPRTYARSYRYPRHGFGVIFERLASRVVAEGATIRTGVSVTGFELGQGRIESIETDNGPVACEAVISTVPLPDMVRMTGGNSPLRFRGLRFLNFPMAVENVSPWTWQYLSDPDMIATRLQEPRRRSPEMAPPGMTSLMMEVPCDPGDPLWIMPDEELFARLKQDLARLGIDPAKATGEVFSARAATAYPLMTVGYQEERERALAHLSAYQNLIQCGRQGTFRYIFTDTAMEMGQMAAAMLIGGADARPAIYAHRNQKTVIETESIA